MLKTSLHYVHLFKKVIAEFSFITGQVMSLKRNQMTDTKLLNIDKMISEESAEI